MRALWLLGLTTLYVGACSGGGSDDTSTEGDDDDDDDDTSSTVDGDDDDDVTGDDDDDVTGDDDDDDTTEPLPSARLIADGDAGAVQIIDVATEADGLSMPSDIAFHPDKGSAWITNRDDDSMVVLTRPGEKDQVADYYWSAIGSNHFLAKPAALAFSEDNFDFATIHEEDELTQGPGATPADFMGPTLWTGKQFQFDGGHASHLDMLHNSPNGVGIAWVEGNAYYVFDGWNDSITFYDFNADHGLGGADHSDGEILRCVEGEVSYVAGVGSHLVFDPATRWLYVADTGNNRIAVLDTNTGTKGGPLTPNYDGLGPGQFNYMDDAVMTTLIEGADHGLELPSGLEIDGDVLYVGDNATGMIHAFALDGRFIASLDLGVDPGALQGFAIYDDAIWFTNESDHTISVVRAN